MLSATILLLHDNAQPHSAVQTQDLITSFMWEQMDHPPVQSWIGAKRFDDDDDDWKMKCISG